MSINVDGGGTIRVRAPNGGNLVLNVRVLMGHYFKEDRGDVGGPATRDPQGTPGTRHALFKACLVNPAKFKRVTGRLRQLALLFHIVFSTLTCRKWMSRELDHRSRGTLLLHSIVYEHFLLRDT